MPKKETQDKKYQNNPYRVENFRRDAEGNLENIHGALLRMNHSIQAEGTFGVMKQDRWYKRIVRKGIKSVKLKLYLVAIGQNLYKYHNKQKRTNSAAA